LQVELSWYEGQEKVDLTDYVNSGTWDIIACPGINVKPTGNETDSGEFRVSQITFILRIRRKVGWLKSFILYLKLSIGIYN